MRLGGTANLDVEAISTGCLSLDMALELCKKGRIIEYWTKSSGKTTLALHIVLNVKKMVEATFIDAENTLDPEYAKNLGVAQTTYWFSRDSGEQALDILPKVARNGCFGCYCY